MWLWIASMTRRPVRMRADADCSRTSGLLWLCERCPLKPGGSVHVPGLGDFSPESIEVLDDPLPLISKTSTLEKSDSVIYAPLSDVGGVAYDDDAVYIDLKTVAYSKDEDLDGEGRKAVTGGAADLVRRLQQPGSVDTKLEKSELRLFGGSRAVRGSTVEEDSAEDSSSDSDSDESSSSSEEEDAARASFFEESRLSLEKRKAAREAGDLGARVYGYSDGEEEDDDDEDDEGDLFRRRGDGPAYKERKAATEGLDASDDDDVAVAFDDDDDDILEGAQHCFATVDDDEAYGDFENLDESDDDSSSDDDAPAADEDKPLEGREAIAAAKARAMAQKAEEDEGRRRLRRRRAAGVAGSGREDR